MLAHAPPRGGSRQLGPPHPGASRPTLGRLTPAWTVPTLGLTVRPGGSPRGGVPGATWSDHINTVLWICDRPKCNARVGARGAEEAARQLDAIGAILARAHEAELSFQRAHMLQRDWPSRLLLVLADFYAELGCSCICSIAAFWLLCQVLSHDISQPPHDELRRQPPLSARCQ